MIKKPIYCWDTTIFAAWLGAPVRPELSIPDMEAVAREIDANDAVLVTSVMAYAEVLRARYSPEAFAKFKAFLTKTNVDVVDITQGVAEKVEELRSACLKIGRSLKRYDATFIAAALKRKAHVLHTTDDGVLALNGHAIVGGLKICMPILLNKQKVFC